MKFIMHTSIFVVEIHLQVCLKGLQWENCSQPELWLRFLDSLDRGKHLYLSNTEPTSPFRWLIGGPLKEETPPLSPILFIEEILEILGSGWIDPKIGVILLFGIGLNSLRISAMAAICRRACVFRRCLRTSARWKYRILSHLNGHVYERGGDGG